MITMATNPYLDALRKIPYAPGMGYDRQYRSYTRTNMTFTDNRGELVREYAWAIPSDEALRKIVNFAPRICEIGAGTGYWAYMLSQYGANVVAYDIAIPGIHDNKWEHKKTWFDVKHGDALTINQHQDRALMLCWPPYSKPMAEAALQLYTGQRVIYIGEGSYGCTATEKFHEILDNEFTGECVDIPQWDGLHDSVYLMERK